MTELPDTPAGRQLSVLLARLAGPSEMTREEVPGFFHQSFVTALGSPEAVANVLNGWSAQSTPFQVTLAEEKSPHTIRSVERTR